MSKKYDEHQDMNLKGTLMSVFFVGAIIIAMWVIVYMMYVAR
ncbi:cytochrome C oxidase subunit II [Planococcus sp. FY231025]